MTHLTQGPNKGGGGAAWDLWKEQAQGNGNLADQVVQSAMRYRAQAPLIDSILKEVGLGSGGPAQLGLAGLLQEGEAGPAKEEKTS